ncbi:MAG: aspartate kinase [Candidatus Paceibacterota bacterium]|jgi:aspartate kinase
MSKKITVNKFGGGILKKELMPIIVKRLKEQLISGSSPIAVVSAMPGITDSLVYFLLKINEKSLKEKEANSLITTYIKEIKDLHNAILIDIGFNKKEQEKVKVELDKLFYQLEEDLLVIVATDTNILEDKIISYGEKLSATILTNYFNLMGIKAKRFLAEEIPILTDNNFKNANIDYKVSEKNIIKKLSSVSELPVLAGFTGITSNKQTTTLGRGGTDTTACFIGAALRAEKVVLWKDVGGVLSADPKIIKEAKTIPLINYMEAEESGKIIHDKAIQYIKLFQTPIEISSIINPKLKTRIEDTSKPQKGAKIVSLKKDLNFILITDEIIKLNDLLAIVSGTFKEFKMDIILISNTHYSLQIVADNNNGQIYKVYDELRKKVAKIEIVKTHMVFLVGLFDAKDVSNFNDLLVKLGTDLLISAFYYENCNRMEAVIKTADINKVVRALYKKFIK